MHGERNTVGGGGETQDWIASETLKHYGSEGRESGKNTWNSTVRQMRPGRIDSLCYFLEGAIIVLSKWTPRDRLNSTSTYLL